MHCNRAGGSPSRSTWACRYSESKTKSQLPIVPVFVSISGLRSLAITARRSPDATPEEARTHRRLHRQSNWDIASFLVRVIWVCRSLAVPSQRNGQCVGVLCRLKVSGLHFACPTTSLAPFMYPRPLATGARCMDLVHSIDIWSSRASLTSPCLRLPEHLCHPASHPIVSGAGSLALCITTGLYL